MCAFLPLRPYSLGMPVFLLVLHGALAICLIVASLGKKLYECLTCIYLILMIFHMSSSYLFFFFIACAHLFAVGWNLLVLVLLFEYYGHQVYILGDWARWSGLLPTELEGVLFSLLIACCAPPFSHCIFALMWFYSAWHLCVFCLTLFSFTWSVSMVLSYSKCLGYLCPRCVGLRTIYLIVFINYWIPFWTAQIIMGT